MIGALYYVTKLVDWAVAARWRQGAERGVFAARSAVSPLRSAVHKLEPRYSDFGSVSAPSSFGFSGRGGGLC